MHLCSSFSCNGLTLVELLVALVVTSIVLTAVATLAFAMTSANDATDDTTQKQAQIRYATLRISELIRHCKLVCCTPGNDMVIWKADNNPDNGKMDILELAYIERGNNRDYLRILDFSTCPDWLQVWFRNLGSQISTIQQSTFKDLLLSNCQEIYTPVLPQCSNAQFNFDVLPPNTKFVSISFDLVENNVVRRYQINARLRSWAGNLLNQSGDGLVSDDD